MYVSDYSLQLLHQDRLRDAAKQHAQSELIRDVNEQAPNEVESGLLHQIKQWMHVENHQTQERSDVQPVPAV